MANKTFNYYIHATQCRHASRNAHKFMFPSPLWFTVIGGYNSSPEYYAYPTP